jgi:hypothetical protein
MGILQVILDITDTPMGAFPSTITIGVISIIVGENIMKGMKEGGDIHSMPVILKDWACKIAALEARLR